MGTNIISSHFKQLLDSHVFIFIIKMLEDNADTHLTTKKVLKYVLKLKTIILNVGSSKKKL